jgi:hypothetical protein
MPTLQTVVPEHIAEAVQKEAEARVPKDSVSRVLSEIVVPEIERRIALRKTSDQTTGAGIETASK